MSRGKRRKNKTSGGRSWLWRFKLWDWCSELLDAILITHHWEKYIFGSQRRHLLEAVWLFTRGPMHHRQKGFISACYQEETLLCVLSCLSGARPPTCTRLVKWTKMCSKRCRWVCREVEGFVIRRVNKYVLYIIFTTLHSFGHFLSYFCVQHLHV